MKNHTNSFAEKLVGQESMNSKLNAEYQKRIADMADNKLHWLIRILCGLIALGGLVFAVSLVAMYFHNFRYEIRLLARASIFLLLVCVVFYSSWAAMAAIRGKSRFGSAPSVILGALVATGFFGCMWTFLIFILPKVFEFIHPETENPMMSNIWIVSYACILTMIGFFGVLTAGLVFTLHLLCAYHVQNRRKLLEIELAIAELLEQKNDTASVSAG